MLVNYEIGENTDYTPTYKFCLTMCGNGIHKGTGKKHKDSMVGSIFCKEDCKNFVSHNEDEKTIECSMKEKSEVEGE